jgi:Arc/MetJ-type ribon-helix-helix transcriptional regulator
VVGWKAKENTRMTIHLSKDLERFVHDAVRSGLYASDDDVIRDALMRLKKTMPEGNQTPGKSPKRSKAAPQLPKKPLTPAELDQYMLKVGLLSQLPDTDADFDDPDDEPITIKGEPLSETIIRERR